jgi:hypothetical protein
MAKLVVLSAGQSGRTHELNAEKTTVGRLEDNTFQIAEQSVSSHHCEILLRGSDVVVKDLNSTNGTFINGEQISEKALKPGQILRLGQIELRLENGEVASAATAPAAAKKEPRGQGGVKFGNAPGGAPSFDKGSPFAKKNNKVALIFITIGVVLAVVIVVLLALAFKGFSS